MNDLKNAKIMSLISVFIVMSIISSKFLSIHFITMKTGVTFIVSALTCAIFGSVIFIISVIVEDFIGNAFFSSAGGFYFPFVITRIVTALVYSYFFYRKDITKKNILIAVFVNSLLTSVFLNTLWVSQVTGNTFIMQLYARVPIILFNYVMNSVVLVLVFPKLVRILRTEILSMNAAPLNAPYKKSSV